MPPTPFEELQRIAENQGVDESLSYLEQQFRRNQQFFKLFEVLKMRCRRKLGLPLTYSQTPDELDDAEQRKLEDGLLGACREVGTLFFKAGKIQEGWMYLQPVSDKRLTDSLLRSIEPTEENMDTLIDIAVAQGGAPAYGYGLLLKHFGTCNGITTFDTQAARFDPETQKQLAQELLRHIYDELLANLQYAIKENGHEAAGDATIGDLLRQFPDVTAGGAHHIDTTHLASVMRIARVVDQPDDLRKASELADYGSKLDKDYQYPGNPPFEDTYTDHQFFYRGLMDENVDAAIEHFKKKCDVLDTAQYGPVAIETLIEFLVRVGRNDEAIDVATKQLVGKFDPMGIAPNVLDIAETSEQAKRLMEFYQEEDDLLNYAVSLLKATSSS